MSAILEPLSNRNPQFATRLSLAPAPAQPATMDSRGLLRFHPEALADLRARRLLPSSSTALADDPARVRLLSVGFVVS